MLRPSTKLEQFISTAESYLGYAARPNRDNIFGERLGMNGQPWDGLFIDVVARESGVPLPSFITPMSALAYFIGSGIFHVKPKRGDIVFFATSTVSDFGSPHVGIVTDASRYSIDGTFETVEGMVASGLPRSGLTPDGVYKRMRSEMDVIGFGRPRYETKPKPANTDGKQLAVVYPAQVKVGMRHANVEPVQLALNLITGVRGLPRGHFDTRTRLAFANFQRRIGYPQSLATGLPDYESLQALADLTGYFIAGRRN